MEFLLKKLFHNCFKQATGGKLRIENWKLRIEN